MQLLVVYKSWRAIVTKMGPSVCHVFFVNFGVLVSRHFRVVWVGVVAGTQHSQIHTNKAPIQLYMIYLYIYIYVYVFSTNIQISPRAKRHRTIDDPKGAGRFIHNHVLRYISLTTCALVRIAAVMITCIYVY